MKTADQKKATNQQPVLKSIVDLSLNLCSKNDAFSLANKDWKRQYNYKLAVIQHDEATSSSETNATCGPSAECYRLIQTDQV